MPRISRPIIYLILFAFAAAMVFTADTRITVLRETMQELHDSMLRVKHAQTTITPTDLAVWQIYHNTKYNYAVKYPKDWTLEVDFATVPGAAAPELGTNINFFGKNMIVSLSRKSNSEKLKPKEWLKKYNIPTDFPPSNYDPLAGFSEQVFYGLPALRHGDNPLSEWFIFSGADVFAVGAFGPNEPTRPFDKDVLAKTYQAMLSTLDFNPPTVANSGGYIVEGWKTYSSAEYGFELQYPDKWNVNLNAAYPTTFVAFGSFSISIENSEFKSSEEWLKWYFLVYSTRPSVPQYLRLIVGGESAIRFDDPVGWGGLGDTIAVVKNGKLYRILAVAPTKELADQILSTFKFIEPSTSADINCKSDSDCPSDYSCEALEGVGTIYPNNSKPPTTQIVKGVCKKKQGTVCKFDQDCLPGLLCHVGACTSPIGQKCSGAGDTGCPLGYQCVQGCGSPVSYVGEPPPPYFCELNEFAAKPRMCPICLASNSNISTPSGVVNVRDIRVGMRVWSLQKNGKRVASVVVKISHTPTPQGHQVVHLVLSDGREVWASPNHPTVSDVPVGWLNVGEPYDGSIVRAADLVPYWDQATYDILPDSNTGFYWANGILLGSTLK